jgi:enamine deaminase RidA (YjgF/YER057c/UK114 family)
MRTSGGPTPSGVGPPTSQDIDGPAVTPEDRLGALGLELPAPPVPVAAYALAVRTGDLLYLSGTTCYRDGQPMYRGKVGRELSVQQGYDAARQTALNLLAVTRDHVGDLQHIAQVVKVNGYVNSAPGFIEQPAVINGASELLLAVLGDRGRHARTSIGVAELPGDIPVEIEMIVRVASSAGHRRAATRSETGQGHSR